MGIIADVQTRFNDTALRIFNSLISTSAAKLITVTEAPTINKSTQESVAGSSETIRAAITSVSSFRDEEPNRVLGEMRAVYLVAEATLVPKNGMTITLPSGSGIVDSGKTYTIVGASEDPSKSVYIVNLGAK